MPSYWLRKVRPHLVYISRVLLLSRPLGGAGAGVLQVADILGREVGEDEDDAVRALYLAVPSVTVRTSRPGTYFLSVYNDLRLVVATRLFFILFS